MTKSKPSVVLYLRVSSSRQQEKMSIERQRKLLPGYVASEGWQEIGRYQDDGLSGKTAEGRPGFMAMLADLPKLRPDYVLVVSPDRAGRPDPTDVKHLIQLALAVAENGGTIACPDGFRCPPNDGVQFIEWQRKLLGAGQQNVRHGLNVRQGKLTRLLRGEWPFQTCIFGFRVSEDRRSFEPVKSEIELVREIFSRIVDKGQGQPSIAAWLRAEKIPTSQTPGRHKAARWQSSTVRMIVNHEAYVAGELTYDVKTMFADYAATCAKYREHPGITEYELPEDGLVRWPLLAHDGQPVISRAVWDRARAMMAVNKRTRGRPRKDDAFLFRKWLRCGECGYGFNTCSTADNKNGTDKRWHYYECLCSPPSEARRDGRPRCKMPRLRADEVDKALWNQLLDFIRDPGRLADAWLDQQVTMTKTDRLALDKRLQQLDASIADAESKKRELVGLFAESSIDRAALIRLSRERDAELTALRQERQEAAERLAAATDKREAVAEAKAETRKASEYFKRLEEGSKLRRKLDALPRRDKERLIGMLLGPEFITLERLPNEEIVAQSADADDAADRRAAWVDAKAEVAVREWAIPVRPSAVLGSLAEIGLVSRKEIDNRFQ